ncbi:MAG: pseudaminic acid cytidylyltransferase [Bdellovibrionota bacterium]
MAKVLAIIPARGGSKRIPRKNIKPFQGKPVIQYPISNCLKIGKFDEVMVSTDDQEIKEVALKSGASVPFLRSPANSNDFAGTMEVIREVLKSYEAQGKTFTHFCCIYPTTPLLRSEYILEGFRKITEGNADFLISVNEFGFPIQRAVSVKDGKLQMLWPENYSKRSQDLEKTYHDAGQFYFGKTESAFKYDGLMQGLVDYVEIPRAFSQDIDTIEDWTIAEQKFLLLNP